jgi:AraC-like DNA-binding protein
MFYLSGVALALFLDLLLLTKNRKAAADYILAAWLLVITIHLLTFYFVKANVYPQLLGADIPMPLAHGPLLYLYTRALTNRTVPTKFAVLHFLPFIAVAIYITPFFASPVEEKIYVYENRGIGHETFGLIKSIANVISGIVYLILSSVALRKHRQAIADQFSSIEHVNLRWLQYLIYWIGAIWFFVILGADDWVFGSAVFFILFVGYFGIRQGNIFHSPQITVPAESSSSDSSIDETESDEEIPGPRKYEKSGLTYEISETIHRDLSSVMYHEKLFRLTELSLGDLAERLNAQPNHLSQVINEREGKNFYDYVNSLRVEEFKRLASSPESRKYTLIALAQECGFNSKSSFNRYFKKVTGQSPTKFLETQNG